MGDSEDEVYFPRGGSSILREKSFKKQSTFIFDKTKKDKKRKKNPGSRERERLKKANSRPEYVHDTPEKIKKFHRLTYPVLEGTLSMCCVTEVHPKSLSVKLPDRISAKVFAENLSPAYANSPTNLNKLFKVGDCYPCRRITSENVAVSLNPADVNSELTFSQLSKGVMIIGVVESETDHGFVIYTGIPLVTAFLPKKQTSNFIQDRNDNKPLILGQLLWCKVSKSNMADGKNIIEVTIDPKIVVSNEISRIASEMLIPGASFASKITKVEKDIVHISLNRTNFEGYITQDHLIAKANTYHVGNELSVFLLYKYPHSDVAAYSLRILPTTRINKIVPDGTLIQRAKICSVNPRGVFLEFEHDGSFHKGIISRRNMESANFPIGNHITVKTIGFDYLDPYYSCSNSNEILQEKFCSLKDIVVGGFVSVKIEENKADSYSGKVGKVRAFVPKDQISDEPSKANALKIGSVYEGRVLKVLNHISSVIVTLKPLLMNNEPLLDIRKAQKGEFYYGNIDSVLPDGIKVSFFNGIHSVISASNLITDVTQYKIGQTVKCYVLNDKKVEFSLLKSVDQSTLSIGRSYTLVVTENKKDKLVCLGGEKGEQFKVEIALYELSDHPELWEFILSKHQPGEFIDAYVFNYFNGKPIFSLKESTKSFFQGNQKLVKKGKEGVKKNMIVPFILKISQKPTLVVPFPNFNREINFDVNDSQFNHFRSSYTPLSFYENQTVMAQIESFNEESNIKLFRNVELSDEKWAVENLKSFMNSISPYQDYEVGDQVKLNLESKRKSKEKILRVEKGGKTFLVYDENKTVTKTSFKVSVLYDDILNKVVHTVPTSRLEKDECDGQENCDQEEVEILFSNWVLMVGWIKRTQNFVYIPCKGFLNSYEPNFYAQGTRDVKILSIENDLRFGYPLNIKEFLNPLPEHIRSGMEKWLPLKNLKSLEIPQLKNKKKKEKNDGNKNKKENNEASEKKLKNAQKEVSDKKRKLQESKAEVEVKKKKIEELNELSLENVGGFDFDVTPSDLANVVTQGIPESEEEESDDEKKPKKKMTPAEKKAAAIEAEKRLREKEEELLQSDSNPQSADHFDRVLLGEPNNSKRWIQYMAFHLQTADFDKARSVAKRALKTINPREEQEKLNVWIALLNLDHTYSPPEVFQETLKEALKYNDDYAINSRVLEIYSEAKKAVEVDQLTKVLTRKYRNKIDCWLQCQNALMAVGLTDKSRSFLLRAISSLQQKEHVSLMSRHALLENKHGYPEEADCLFEKLLTSYPQRVDIWNVYVDMLIKSNRIDVARTVLERIPSHKLPIRKMKSLYSKWISFEEAYGTPASILAVKAAAQNYVENVTRPVKVEEAPKKEEISDEEVDGNFDHDDDDDDFLEDD